MKQALQVIALALVTFTIMTSIVALATSNMPSKAQKIEVAKTIMNGIY